jgi:hypothetical protein
MVNMPGGIYYTKSSDAGTSWAAATVVVDSINQPMHPFFALSKDVVHMIWSDIRDGHRAI